VIWVVTLLAISRFGVANVHAADFEQRSMDVRRRVQRFSVPPTQREDVVLIACKHQELVMD
jgi:hypothetical protein